MVRNNINKIQFIKIAALSMTLLSCRLVLGEGSQISMNPGHREGVAHGGVQPLVNEQLQQLATELKLAARCWAKLPFKDRSVQLEKFIIEKTLSRRPTPIGEDWDRILSLVVDERGKLCGLEVCAKAISLNRSEINPLLDRIYDNVQHHRYSALGARDQSLLLKSLQRQDSEQLWNDIGVGSESHGIHDSKDHGIVGTCATPSTQAFALRSQRHVVPIRAQIQGTRFSKAIDYRKENPYLFQGSTGACHIYSLRSMFDFSQNHKLKALSAADPLRNFVDIWTDNLGGTIEAAIDHEVQYINELVQLLRKYEKEQSEIGLIPIEIREKWFRNAQIPVRNHAQGSNVYDDFERIKKHGYVRAGASGPPIMRQSLEGLAREIGNKRLEFVKKIAEGRNMESQIRAEMLPLLQTLFAMRKANDPLRTPLDPSLSDLKIEAIDFNHDHLEESINEFFKVFATYGPVGISRQSHATTVVAYDHVAQIFYIRDSRIAAPGGYTQVSYQAFFSYLSKYYFIKDSSSAPIEITE